MKTICYIAVSLLIVSVLISLSTIWATPVMAQGDTPTPTYIAPYVVVTVQPGGSNPDCLELATTATPDPNICTWSSYDTHTNAWAHASVAACIYVTTTFSYQGRAWFTSRCLSSNADTSLDRYPITLESDVVNVICSDTGGGIATTSGSAAFHPDSAINPNLYVIEGNASPCNDQYCGGGGGPKAGYAYAELSLGSCAPTPTPTVTPTPTPTGQASAQSDCIDISYIYPLATRLTQTNQQIDTIDVGINDEIFSDITISSDPISMAKGFIIMMSDIAWLKILFGFFIVAIMIILALMAARSIIAMWGIVDRLISLIKLIPFL